MPQILNMGQQLHITPSNIEPLQFSDICIEFLDCIITSFGLRNNKEAPVHIGLLLLERLSLL